MLKKVIMCVGVGFFFTQGVSAVAQSGFYIRGAIGDSSIIGLDEDIFKSGDGLRQSGAFGYYFDNGWRVEGEVARRYNEVGLFDNDGRVVSTIWSGKANIIYDFKGFRNFSAFTKSITPYVGAGFGGSDMALELNAEASLITDFIQIPFVEELSLNDLELVSVTIDDSDNPRALQMFAGLGFALSERLTLEAEYRLSLFEKSTFRYEIDSSILSEIGLDIPQIEEIANIFPDYSVTADTVDLDILAMHSLWVGLRFRFGPM